MGDSEFIAIVDMAGRFPGAPDLRTFWANLTSATASLTVLDTDELHAAGIGPEVTGDPRYVRRASLLDDIEYVDANFFGISRRHAETIDPQQRLFLECACGVPQCCTCR